MTSKQRHKAFDSQSHIGIRVQVYRNLHNGLWSVRDKKTRRVLGHTEEILLIDCLCMVSKSGRSRVLRDKQKNVHAWIEGTVFNDEIHTSDFSEITYNPYLYESFVLKSTDDPIYSSTFVHMDIQIDPAGNRKAIVKAKPSL